MPPRAGERSRGRRPCGVRCAGPARWPRCGSRQASTTGVTVSDATISGIGSLLTGLTLEHISLGLLDSDPAKLIDHMLQPAHTGPD